MLDLLAEITKVSLNNGSLILLDRVEEMGYKVMLINKTNDSPITPEVHLKEDDIYLVLGGKGFLYSGGEIVNKRSLSNDNTQFSGDRLIKCECKEIKQGDILIIPKGVAHMVRTETSLTYIVLKENSRKCFML